jgi:hypothetical protein
VKGEAVSLKVEGAEVRDSLEHVVENAQTLDEVIVRKGSSIEVEHEAES